MENQTTLLKIEEARLEEGKKTAESALKAAENNLAVRSQEIEADLRKARKDFERREAEFAAKLEEERLRSAAEIAAIKQSTEAERQRLAQDLKTLNDEIGIASEKLAKAEEALLLAPARADLETLRLTDEAIWQDPAMDRLIQMAKDDAAVVAVVEEKIQSTDNPAYASGLLYLLYMARPSEANLMRFVDFVEANHEDAAVWELFGGGYWSAETALRILDEAFDFAAAGKMNEEAMKEFAFFFHLYPMSDHNLRQSLRSTKALPFLRLALQIAQNGDVGPLSFRYFATIFTVIDGELGALVIESYFNKLTEAKREELRLGLEEVVLGLPNSMLAEALTGTGLLSAIRTKETQAWLSEFPAPGLADALSSGDIEGAIALTSTQ